MARARRCQLPKVHSKERRRERKRYEYKGQESQFAQSLRLINCFSRFCNGDAVHQDCNVLCTPSVQLLRAIVKMIEVLMQRFCGRHCFFASVACCSGPFAMLRVVHIGFDLVKVLDVTVKQILNVSQIWQAVRLSKGRPSEFVDFRICEIEELHLRRCDEREDFI